jgi:hypothetical protein
MLALQVLRSRDAEDALQVSVLALLQRYNNSDEGTTEYFLLCGGGPQCASDKERFNAPTFARLQLKFGIRGDCGVDVGCYDACGGGKSHYRNDTQSPWGTWRSAYAPGTFGGTFMSA